MGKFTEKYQSRGAALYRELLEEEVNGSSRPTTSGFSQYASTKSNDDDFADFSDEEEVTPTEKKPVAKKNTPSPKVLGSKPASKFGAKRSGLSATRKSGAVLASAPASKKKSLASQKLMMILMIL